METFIESLFFSDVLEGWFSFFFNGISTYIGYFMPKP